MKKHIASILTLALILCSLTACHDGGAEDLPGAQGSATDSTISDTESSSSADQNSDSTPDEPHEIGIYGETEIPDIPFENTSNEGKANDMTDAEALKNCPDNMVFETHTFGEYTVNLVGDCVRTDKSNYPNNIYTRKLRVEIEKNGTKIEGNGHYCDLFLREYQFNSEYILLADKIGSYLDIYDLEIPVIAMRYFFDESSGETITKAVEISMLRNDEYLSGFLGEFAQGTGVVPPSGTTDAERPALPARLRLNTKDGEPWRAGIFAADEFKIADGKTLVDEEAGIKYVFDFSEPYGHDGGRAYKTEWIKSADSTPDEPKEIGIYGETEIPDIPCGDPDFEGKIHGMDYDKINKIVEQCLDSMVLETHTYGEYTINLIGECVRTDKENFPDSIYAETLRVDVLRNGEKIDNKHEFYYTGSGMLTYLLMGYNEFKLFTDKIGSYLDFYELDTPVIAMRYYYDEGREVTKAVGFATIGEDEIYNPLWGSCEKGTGITFNPDSTVNDPGSQLAFNTEDDWGCSVSIFAADKFRIADGKTLVDDEAGVKYTFDFSDPYELEGKIYKTEWIK